MLLIGQIKIQCSHIYLSYITKQLKFKRKHSWPQMKNMDMSSSN